MNQVVDGKKKKSAMMKFLYHICVFYTQTRLHRNYYSQKLLHTETCLHRGAFTHRFFLHREVFAQEMFTYKNFTQRIAYMFIHSDAFTHRCFYTQKLLHRGVFTHRRVYTEEFLHTDACTHRTLKVLRPYFLSPFRKWHKKGSSPRNHSNAEGLQQRCWIPQPRVYSNVHSRLIHSRLLTFFEPLCVPFRAFTYLLGPQGRTFYSCSRLLTLLYSNVPFEVRDLRRYIERVFIATFLHDV